MFLFYYLLSIFSVINIINTIPVNVDLNSTNSSSPKDICVGVCPQVTIFKKPKCFSLDNWVKLADNQRQNIGELRYGQKILAYDGSNLSYSEVIYMLDKNTQNKALFYSLFTESNHTISLTPEHLIAVATKEETMKYIAAKHIRINHHSLYVISTNGTLMKSAVVRIESEIKIGYISPLTMTGLLFVNNVLATPFAHVHSYRAAQIAMTPIRWYHSGSKLISLFSSDNNKQAVEIHDGILWFAEALFNFALKFYPSALDL